MPIQYKTQLTSGIENSDYIKYYKLICFQYLEGSVWSDRSNSNSHFLPEALGAHCVTTLAHYVYDGLLGVFVP